MSSCSKNNNINTNLNENLVSDTLTSSFPHLIYQIPVGAVSDEIDIPKTTELHEYLLVEEFFDIVISSNFEYQYDSISNNYNAYITLIGEENGKALSYQFDLLVDNSSREVYLQTPIFDLTSGTNTVNVHECNGSNCSSCSFVKEKKKIVGCTCNSSAGGPGPSGCNHSMTDGIDINKIIELASKLIGLFG